MTAPVLWNTCGMLALSHKLKHIELCGKAKQPVAPELSLLPRCMFLCHVVVSDSCCSFHQTRAWLDIIRCFSGCTNLIKVCFEVRSKSKVKPEGFFFFPAFKSNLVSIVTRSLERICTLSVCCYELTHLRQGKSTLKMMYTGHRVCVEYVASVWSTICRLWYTKVKAVVLLLYYYWLHFWGNFNAFHLHTQSTIQTLLQL